MARARIFSIFDIKAAFYKVKVTAKDVPKTAFRTRGGLWEHKRMAMGLKNGSSTFSRLVELIFADLSSDVITTLPR